MRQLTDEDIARQDFVDQSISELIDRINPTGRTIEWDIEMIGDVRDTINHWLTKRLELCSEQQFYPFVEI